jgi:hypothetical protein
MKPSTLSSVATCAAVFWVGYLYGPYAVALACVASFSSYLRGAWAARDEIDEAYAMMEADDKRRIVASIDRAAQDFLDRTNGVMAAERAKMDSFESEDHAREKGE